MLFRLLRRWFSPPAGGTRRAAPVHEVDAAAVTEEFQAPSREAHLPVMLEVAEAFGAEAAAQLPGKIRALGGRSPKLCGQDMARWVEYQVPAPGRFATHRLVFSRGGWKGLTPDCEGWAELMDSVGLDLTLGEHRRDAEVAFRLLVGVPVESFDEARELARPLSDDERRWSVPPVPAGSEGVSPRLLATAVDA